MFTIALGLFAISLFLALVEIEVEGKYGWAERIPTWYRTTGFAGRLWGLIMGGKPLTGYHLFLNILLLSMFHFKFLDGAEWSGATELTTLAKFFAMTVCWDFMWFVFNPNYTLKNYKRENIWWFAKSYWVFGIFPFDYVAGWGASVLLAGLSGLAEHSAIASAMNQMCLLGFLLVFIFIAIILSPVYRWWYKKMRLKDNRDKAGIFHRLP